MPQGGISGATLVALGTAAGYVDVETHFKFDIDYRDPERTPMQWGAPPPRQIHHRPTLAADRAGSPTPPPSAPPQASSSKHNRKGRVPAGADQLWIRLSPQDTRVGTIKLAIPRSRGPLGCPPPSSNATHCRANDTKVSTDTIV